MLIGGSGSKGGGGGWLLASLHLCCFYISYWLTFTENCLLEARKEENNCHNNCRHQWILHGDEEKARGHLTLYWTILRVEKQIRHYIMIYYSTNITIFSVSSDRNFRKWL